MELDIKDVAQISFVEDGMSGNSIFLKPKAGMKIYVDISCVVGGRTFRPCEEGEKPNHFQRVGIEVFSTSADIQVILFNNEGNILHSGRQDSYSLLVNPKNEKMQVKATNGVGCWQKETVLSLEKEKGK